MKTWAIIDTLKHEEYLHPFDDKETAIKEADKEWDFLTDFDKKRRQSYLVGLVNLDEDGNYHEDENGNIDADIYEVAKEYK